MAGGTALLLVDVQNDFGPGGALAVTHGDRVVPVLNEYAAQVRAAGGAVFASRDWHPPDTVHFRVRGGPWLPAVTNLGRRPAVGGSEPLLEVHFFDFDEDLYGQRLEVQFVAKLRDELDFDTLEELVEQMKQDEDVARQLLANANRPGEQTTG